MHDELLEGETAAIPDENVSIETDTSEPTTAVDVEAGEETPKAEPEAIIDGVETPEDDAKESKSQRKRRLSRERDAERDAELAEKRAEIKALRERLESQMVPNPDDFQGGEFDPDFIRKMGQYNAQMGFVEIEGSRLDYREQQQRAQRQTAAAEHARALGEEARQRYADFNDKVAVANGILGQSGQGLQEAMEIVVSQDNGADVAYYLGANPGEMQRLAHLDAMSATYQLAQIAAKVTRPQPKKATNAPAPINTVKPSGSSIGDPEKMSMAEYRAARMAGKI